MRDAKKRNIAKHAGVSERRYQRLFFPGQYRPGRPYDIGGVIGGTDYRGEVKERPDSLGPVARFTLLGKALDQVEGYSRGHHECFAVLHILGDNYQHGTVARRGPGGELLTCLVAEFLGELRGQQRLKAVQAC